MFVLFYFTANNDMLLAERIPGATVQDAVEYINNRHNDNCVPFRLTKEGESETSLYTWCIGYCRVKTEMLWWKSLCDKA